jgi:hypothetical protein
MLTVAELEAYLDDARKLLSEDERSGVIDYLSKRPKAGVLITGTSGIRKLRWGRADKGKSGGVRVIYYFHSEVMPLYLITIFGKGDKENLTKEERNSLAEMTRHLTSIWLERQK